MKRRRLNSRDRSRESEYRSRRPRQTTSYRELEAKLEEITRKINSLAVDVDYNKNDIVTNMLNIRQSSTELSFWKLKIDECLQAPHRVRRHQQKYNAAKSRYYYEKRWANKPNPGNSGDHQRESNLPGTSRQEGFRHNPDKKGGLATEKVQEKEQHFFYAGKY